MNTRASFLEVLRDGYSSFQRARTPLSRRDYFIFYFWIIFVTFVSSALSGLADETGSAFLVLLSIIVYIAHLGLYFPATYRRLRDTGLRNRFLIIFSLLGPGWFLYVFKKSNSVDW